MWACLLFAPAAVHAQVGPEAASASDAADAARADDPTRTDFRWRWEAVPSQRLHEARFGPARGMPGFGPLTPTDYRLWIGTRQTEFGIGVLPAATPAEGGEPTVVLALRYQLSPRTRLTFDTEVGGAGASPATRWRHVPLNLELASSPLEGLAKGTLLRTQLSAHSSLALRLRGGKLGLYLGVRLTGYE